MERITDDGLGKKKTEKYKAKRDLDGMLYEVSDDVIEDIANDKKIVVNRGKHFNFRQEEWENTRIIDFRENFETI